MIRNIKCKDCGANIDMSGGKAISFCPYCGATVIRASNPTEELDITLRHEEKMTETKLRLELEKQKEQHHADWRMFVAIAIGELALLIIVLIAYR